MSTKGGSRMRTGVLGIGVGGKGWAGLIRFVYPPVLRAFLSGENEAASLKADRHVTYAGHATSGLFSQSAAFS